MKFTSHKVSRFNTNLTHFRMYKDGKRWIFAASAFLMLGGGLAMPTVAHADTTDNVATATMKDATSSDSSPTATSSSNEKKHEEAATAQTTPQSSNTQAKTDNHTVDQSSQTTTTSSTKVTADKTASSTSQSTGATQANSASTTDSATPNESTTANSESKANPVDQSATSVNSTNSATKSADVPSSTAVSATKSTTKANSKSEATTKPTTSETAQANTQDKTANSQVTSANQAGNAAKATDEKTTTNAATPVKTISQSALKATLKAATTASTQSDSTKIVTVDKMNAKDKALHDLNNAWQGSDYAASIAADASGLDNLTNQYFVDEWLPDKVLQQFILDQLTSEAGKPITLPDSGKTISVTNGNQGAAISIANANELTKNDLQYLLALVSSKTTGTTIYDQSDKTLSANELFKNLEGIQYASNLNVLDLRGHDGVAVDMAEVSPLAKTLSYLALSGNQVTGKLDLSQASDSLSDLYLERTALTGDLSQLSQLTGLVNVSIGNTNAGDTAWTSNMQGTAFPTTASAATLKTLNLRGLGLMGTVPSLASYTALNNINISDNKLSGRLPELGVATLGADAKIHLNASQNLFSGSLPTSYLINTWSEFKVANNLRLTGDVPLWYKVNNPGADVFNVNPNYAHDGQAIGAVNASADGKYMQNNMTNVVPDGYDISGNYFDGSAIEANYVTNDLKDLDQTKLIQKVNKVYTTSNYPLDANGNLQLNETDLVSGGDVYKYLDGSVYYNGSEASKYVTAGGFVYEQGDGFHTNNTYATQHSFIATPTIDGQVMVTYADGSTKAFTANDVITLSALQDQTTGARVATPKYSLNVKKIFGDDFSNESKGILSFKLAYRPSHVMQVETSGGATITVSGSTGNQDSGLNYFANVTLGINATSLGDLSAGQDVSNTYSPIIKNADGSTTKIGSDIVVSGQTGLNVPATQLQDIVYNGQTYHAKTSSSVVKNSDGTYSLTGTFGDADARYSIEYGALGNVNVHYQVQHPDGTITDMPNDANEVVDESAHNVGDSVSVTAKTFDGYKIVGSDTSSITLTDADQDVTFTFTNTAEEIAAGQTAGKTDGETGKTNDVANKSEDYQAGYKAANDATLKDYSAGQTAGYHDGVTGKTSGTTQPGSDIADPVAWQNGYAETTKGYPAGKASYDQDKATGTIDGNKDGLAGKNQADTTSQSQGYQDGYTEGYTTGKASYDADYLKGQGLANTDVLAGKTTATNHASDSQGLQDGYSKQFTDDQDIQRLGGHNGTQTVLDGKTSDLSGDASYTGDVKTIYDNAYTAAFNQATNDLNAGKKAALNDVTGKKAEGSSITETSSDAFKKGYTDTYSVAQTDFRHGETDGKTDGMAGNSAMKDANRTKATYPDVYDAGYADGYQTGAAIKDQKDKDIAAGQNDADKDFNHGQTSGDSKKTDGSDDYKNAYDQEAQKNAADYAAGVKDAQTDLNTDSKEGTSKKTNQSAAYNAGYTDAWQKGQTANTNGYGDGYNDGFYDTKDKNNHVADQGDYQHPYQKGYDKGFAEGQADRAAHEADIKKGQADADKDFSGGKTSGASKDPKGSDVYQKAYDDEATKNANDYAAGKADGQADGQAGKPKNPKANQSDAYNQGYNDGYSTGKDDYDKNHQSSGDHSGSNSGSNTDSNTKTTDPVIDKNSDDYKAGYAAGEADGAAGKQPANNTGKSANYQAGYQDGYQLATKQHDEDYTKGQAAGKADGQAGKHHADNSQQSEAYQAGYDSTYFEAKAKYDQNKAKRDRDYQRGYNAGKQDRNTGKKHAANANQSADYQSGYDNGYGTGDTTGTLGSKNGQNDNRLLGGQTSKLASSPTTNGIDHHSGQRSMKHDESMLGKLPQTGDNQANTTEAIVVGAAVLFATLGSAIVVKRKKNQG